MGAPRLRVRIAEMLQKTRLLAVALVLAPLALAAQPAKKTELKTPVGKFGLEVTAEYLGMAGTNTVVRIRLASPELSKAAASILGDEAMHWAILRNALGDTPVPAAFVS